MPPLFTADDVLSAIEGLAHDDQLLVYQQLKRRLYPAHDELQRLVPEVRERRFREGVMCPHCQSRRTYRNGKALSRQRYVCRECQRSFGDLTHSPVDRTKYPNLWMKHLDLMVKGYSLRTVARKLNIALSTAFYWRHKVLNGLRSLPLEEFEGVTEADEMYFLESQKGRRRIPHRKPRKRGGVAKSRGLSRDQICVFVGRDRNRNTQARVAGTGQMSKARAAHLLDEGVAHVTVLCTDSAGAYRKFAESKNIPHYSLNASKKERVLKGIYHIQNVNAFQSRLRQWILRFKGVSTKHLDNYLAWFHFLDDHGTEALQPKIRTLLLAACEKPVVQSYVSIKNTPLNLPA